MGSSTTVWIVVSYQGDQVGLTLIEGWPRFGRKGPLLDCPETIAVGQLRSYQPSASHGAETDEPAMRSRCYCGLINYHFLRHYPSLI